jgi:nucleotide-binding universal stress UspA family protein
MSAYRTVVVGTDGSDSSLRAVDRAGAIAAQSGAKVYVATVVYSTPATTVPRHRINDPTTSGVLGPRRTSTKGSPACHC